MLIIFDLDDTLIDTSKTIIPWMLKKALNKMIVEGLIIENEELAYKILLNINKKSNSSKEAIKRFLEKCNADNKFLDIGVRVVYSEFDDDIKILTLRDAKEILYDLFSSNKLAIVSYGKKELQYKKLKKAGIDTSLFSKIVITEKKDKEPCYKQIIEQMNIRSSDTMVIGDKIDIDLIPAKKLGCITVHMKHGRGVNFKKDNNVDYSISTLHDIKSILEKI